MLAGLALIKAWLLMVIFTVTCWLFNWVPGSVACTVRIALMTPAVAVETFGATTIETLLVGVTVPLTGDIESRDGGFALSVIAQFSGALPGLDRVNACCAGFCPWIALKVRALALSTIPGCGVGPIGWVMGGELGVAVTFKVETCIATISVTGLFVPCWKKLI